MILALLNPASDPVFRNSHGQYAQTQTIKANHKLIQATLLMSWKGDVISVFSFDFNREWESGWSFDQADKLSSKVWPSIVYAILPYAIAAMIVYTQVYRSKLASQTLLYDNDIKFIKIWLWDQQNQMQ